MTTEEKTFIQSIWENRFIKYVVPYVIAAWGVIQVSAFLEDRYSWANGWPDFILIFALAMLPAVLLFSYFRGKSSNKLTKIEKFALPFNFLIALALAYFGVGNTTASGTSTKISVLDEEGQTIERTIPDQSEFKRVVLLSWENKNNNPDDQWMSFGLPQMLSQDMEQDVRVISVSPQSQAYAFEEYGVKLDQTPPFSIQRKIASDKYSDYFMNGTFEKNGDEYIVQTTLFSTENGKEIYTKKYENADPLTIVDKISEDFRSEIYLENELDDSFVDLPVSNLFSESREALKNHHESTQEFYFNQNIAAAIQKSNQAISLDPNFAIAHSSLSFYYLNLNKDAEAKASIKKAMDLKDALSERMQFMIKHYYLRYENIEKSKKLLEVWSQLYPKDYKPYSRLISFYRQSAQVEKAKQTALRAYENGHSGRLLLTLAQLENSQGNFEKAEEYYTQFEKEYPDKAKEMAGKGDIYLAQGELEKAEKHFQKLLVLEPDKSQLIRKLADIEGRKGNFEGKIKLLDKALKNEKHLQDSMLTMREREFVYLNKGQVNRYFSEMNNRWESVSRIAPISQLKSELWMPYNMEAMIDQQRPNVLEELIAVSDGFDKSVVDYECIVKVNYYIYANEKEKLSQSLVDCEETLTNFSTPQQMNIANAVIEKVNGNYSKAVEYIEMVRDSSKVDKATLAGFAGEIYRLNKDYKTAEEILNAGLNIDPFQSKQLVQLALTFHEQGKKEEAKKALQKAVDVWKEADENYQPAIEARAKLAEWSQ